MGEPGRGTGQNAAVCSRIIRLIHDGTAWREFVEVRGCPGDKDRKGSRYENG